jgi:hypothetical protein
MGIVLLVRTRWIHNTSTTRLFSYSPRYISIRSFSRARTVPSECLISATAVDMAPTSTAALLFSSAFPANSSAVVTSMPTLSMQFAVSQHSQTTSPKQFIPFGVLGVLLILMFLSHVMRYPRRLYVSQGFPKKHPHSTQENPHASQQGHLSFREKGRDTRAGFFPATSFSGSKRLSSFDPHTEAIYSEPTVRLVRGYHAYSPEPRVYLPEEITIPSPSSQTLVNSSRSDISLFNMDIQNHPTRVYLPPALPETFELSLPHCRDDVSYIDNDSTPPSNLVWMPSSNQDPPGLSTPLPHSFPGCIDFTTSSDVLAMSAFQTQPQTSIPSPELFTEGFESASRLAYSPELSPPPLAHAHPILVKRALFPWRRRSFEPSYDTFMNTDRDFTRVSTQCHRPSVPSRLRHFITRSVTTSFSGSQTHSTPASSTGKPSEKSLMGSRSSSNHGGTVRSCRAEEETGARFSDDLNASVRLSELGFISGIPRHSSISNNKSLAQANDSPQRRLLDKFKRLSVPEDMWRNLKGSSAKAENVAKVAQDRRRRESLPCPDILHGTTPECRNSVGLGLSVVSEPRYVEFDAHRILLPPAAADHVQGDVDIGADARCLQASGSLRTVPSRWMNTSPLSCDVHAVIEGGGLPTIQQDMLPDESVEIMLMGRSEGLDGVVP